MTNMLRRDRVARKKPGRAALNEKYPAAFIGPVGHHPRAGADPMTKGQDAREANAGRTAGSIPATGAIFTCIRCEQNYTVEKEASECPVCGWKPARDLNALVVDLNRRLALATSRIRAVVHHWNEFGPEHGFEEIVRRAEVSLHEDGIDQLAILRPSLVAIVEWFEGLPNDELPGASVRKAFAVIDRALGTPSK